MKANIPAITAICSIAILLNSCASSQNALTREKPQMESSPGSNHELFVQMNDGTVNHYSSLKLVTGVLATPHLLADGKIVIYARDIMSYRDERYYAVSSKLLTSTRSGYVATETLPGFAVKVVSGKLNVYCRKYYNGGNSANEYFLQSGNDGYIVSYSSQMMKSMLKEDAKALEYFNSKTRISPKSKKLLTTAQMYNNNQLVTKN